MGVSRRDFLKSAAAGTIGLASIGVLGACTSQTADSSGEASSTAGHAAETMAEETKGASGNGYKDRVTEVIDTDYVVVGSGMTGLCSAVEAAELGLDVVVLEKNSFLGGSSNVAEGVLGLGTGLQEEAGLTEELPSLAQLMKETLEYHHYNCNSYVVKKFYKESGKNVDWLVEMGAPIVAEPFLVEGMNQVRHAYQGKGAAVIQVLGKKAEELGVHTYLDTSGKELIVENGKVCGIYAENEDGVLQINAKGVLLATGGYAGNKEMLKKYAKIADEDFCKDCGIPGRDGDGINMALAAGGAEWKHMGVLQNFGPILKNDTYASQLYAATAASGFRFNEKGERYQDELLDIKNFAFSGNAMQQQKASWSIAGEEQIKEWTEVCAPMGGGFFMVGLVPLPDLPEQLKAEMESDDPQVFFCETLDEVAATAGVDADTLKESVARYNEMCKNGVDEDFMKDPGSLIPVGEAPYYLFKHKIGIFTTCDGVRINEYAQVLNENDEVVEGLFAGGMDAGGLMGDAYDVSVAPCSTQGWCVYCGRAAAQYVKENL